MIYVLSKSFVKLLVMTTLLISHTNNIKSIFLSLSDLASCKDPGSPQNGVRHGNEFGHNKRITFTCLPGFQLKGTPTAVCLSGKWSASIPQCKGTFVLLYFLTYLYLLIYIEFKLIGRIKNSIMARHTPRFEARFLGLIKQMF